MMLQEAWGLAITAASGDAVSHYDATLLAYLGFRVDVGDRLKATFAADPAMPMAVATRGYFFKLFAHPKAESRAKLARDDLQRLVDGGGVNARERAHADALNHWCGGDLAAAGVIWDAITASWPTDVLALKLAHFAHFYAGDAGAMRASLARALPAWRPTMPGYGHILGSYAFALEECGDYAAAERAGRDAVARDATDVWSTHAVAHVMEMQGRTQDGITWLTAASAHWGAINPFVGHVWWHLALFHLDRGAIDAGLALYDRIWPPASEEYLDLCNAASLLLRVEQDGGAVGDRWAALADKARGRLGENLLDFAEAHYALAIAATGEPAPAKLETLREPARSCARAAFLARQGRHREAMALLQAAMPDLAKLGGSHAQRDLFERMLIAEAIAAGRRDVARERLAARLAARPGNRFGMTMQARLAA